LISPPGIWLKHTKHHSIYFYLKPDMQRRKQFTRDVINPYGFAKHVWPTPVNEVLYPFYGEFRRDKNPLNPLSPDTCNRYSKTLENKVGTSFKRKINAISYHSKSFSSKKKLKSLKIQYIKKITMDLLPRRWQFSISLCSSLSRGIKRVSFFSKKILLCLSKRWLTKLLCTVMQE